MPLRNPPKWEDKASQPPVRMYVPTQMLLKCNDDHAESALTHLARAAHLYRRFNPQKGALEPLYRLHATRAKLLQRRGRGVMLLVARHCFGGAAAEKAAALLAHRGAGWEAEVRIKGRVAID